MERFSPEMPAVSAIAKRHGRAPAVISRAISSAFRDGVVEVRRRQLFAISRSADLEKALYARFRCLRKAIVIRVETDQQDPVHEYLGHALAADIMNYPFRDQERLLVGAGRCIFHMADRLVQSELRQRAEGVALIAACGDSYPYHEQSRNVCLDASANTNLLHRAFESKPDVGFPSHLIFLNDAGDSARGRAYFDQFWNRSAPTLAILGVGIADDSHQLFLLTDEEARKKFPPANISPELTRKIRKLYEELNRLRELFPANCAPLVAEIGMHLFSVFPIPAHRANHEVRLLINTVNDLNQHFFAASAGQLNAVRSVLLVAGGSSKARALRYLLDEMSFQPDRLSSSNDPEEALRIHGICTDETSARLMLEDERDHSAVLIPTLAHEGNA